MSKVYAGIGARKTPENVCKDMEKIASYLATSGWILRSGGAIGADSAFHLGCTTSGGNVEIYRTAQITDRAIKLAKRIHPAWHNCKPYAQKMLARNGQIILGTHLDSPVRFVIAWTKDGKDIGGTGHALKIARENNIKIFNLAIEEDYKKVMEIIHVEK